MPKFPVTLLQSPTTPAEEVKNLCVTFDNHACKVCHACYYHLRDLQCICKVLTVDTALLVPTPWSVFE